MPESPRKRFPTIQVDQAEDGQELLELAAKNQYGLIITDHNMPIVTGLQAIREIREYDTKTPILMISGSNLEQFALEAGATRYLEKPVMPWTVEEVIKELYQT